MEQSNNIVLIGMPGSGKSYIGQKLAELLPNYILLDTDGIIEKTQGMAISDIFEKFSEDYFRKLEYDTIKMVCSGKNKIVSIGGGAFENPDSRNTLLKFGTVFYLKSDLDVLYNRVSKENTRPLLNNENPKAIMEKLLNKREQNYQKAHFVIDTNQSDENEITDFIIGSINAANSSCRS